MILECACGKKYRLKDDAPNRPTKCPACGATLKVTMSAGGTVPQARELEARIRDLEKQLEEAGAAAPAPAVADNALQNRLEQFQREDLALRSEMERQLKGLEGIHALALEEKQKTIDALDAGLASHRSKIDQLQARVDSAEAARVSDAASFELRLSSREQELRTEVQKGEEAHRRALADLRATLEQQIGEKDRLITEARQIVDREAGERRRLSEVLSRLQETADRSAADKRKAVEALEAEVASYRAKADGLQARVDDLERLRRSEQDSYTSRLRAREGAQARLEEGGHLAADLDHSLEGLSTVLGGLRDRVRRLKDTLQAPPGAEPEPAPAAVPPPAPAPEPSHPALSQTAGFGAMRLPRAARVAPLPQQPPTEPEPLPESELEAVQEMPAPVEEAPALEPAPESEVPVAETAAPAAEETEEAVPLISPPEDAPAPEAPAPNPEKKGFVSRFSWRKK